MFTVCPQEYHEALQAARQRQSTPEFKAAYATHAGIEGTLSQRIRDGDLRRALGYDQINLFSVSYGTILPQAMLCEQPDHLRSS